MLRLVTTQLREWESYENSNAGFDKVENLLGELKNMLAHIGQLTVGSGRGYQSGSFNQTLEVLSGLTTDMSRYNQTNAKVASSAWQDIVDDYVKDVKKSQEAAAKAKSEGAWDLIWDGVQILTGAVVTVVGIGLTPLTGGFSLGLTALGGSLLVGGINSAIKDGSQAITGKGVSLIGMAGDGIGSWYSKHVAQPAIASGNPWLSFGTGVLGGVGDMAKGLLSFNAYDAGKGIYNLAFDPSTRKAFGQGLSHWWQQVSSGDAYTLGETASLLSKTGTFVKTLGSSGAKNVKHLIGTPGRIGNSLSDLLKNPRIAFAGIGESNPLLNRIKGVDALPNKNGVQNRFNQVVGEGSEVVVKTPPKTYRIPDEVKAIFSEYQLSIEDFNRLNAKRVKTAQEIALLKEIREKIPTPTSTTTMRKVIPIERLDGTISNPKYANVGGFVTDQTYVRHISEINDVIASSRLDYADTLFKVDGDYAYIDFITEEINKASIPYSPEFGGREVSDWPFRGSGFTAGENGTIVPEWQVPKGESMVPKVKVWYQRKGQPFIR